MNSHLSYRAELGAALGAAQARYRALHDDPQVSDAAIEAALADAEVRYWSVVGEPAAPEAAEILGHAQTRAAEAEA